jgi:hypothetical protein
MLQITPYIKHQAIWHTRAYSCTDVHPPLPVHKDSFLDSFGVSRLLIYMCHTVFMWGATKMLAQWQLTELCCSKIAEAEAAVSVDEKKSLVMHMHVQLKLDELRGPPTLGSL